jgi:DNA-binding MarR family transcriptional regulator
MTDTDSRPLNGQDIGQAERATRAVLDRLLAETGTSFHQWVAVNVLATTGPVVEREQLVRQLVAGLRIDASTAHATLAELVDLGLVEDDMTLTAAGEDRFRRVRDGIDGISQRLYRDLPLDDLVTARRVLATVAERANAELAPG